MFRPQIQKTRILVLIAIFNLLMVYFAVNSKVKVYQVGYDRKIEASSIMKNTIDSFKSLINYEISEKDLFSSGLLGVKTSLITTKEEVEGLDLLSSKIACTHPNFAAAIVEMFYEMDIKENDIIAVSMTGSFPGANIALLSACKAMNVKPVIISSGGSSSWGANRPEYSWPKIESLLYEKNIIDYKSVAYAIGGGNDLGDNLDYDGSILLSNAIFKLLNKDNEFINEPSLSDNVIKRLDVYKKYSDIDKYSLYVNIGGGSASVGAGNVQDSLSVGVISPIDLEYINNEGFQNTVSYSFLKSDIPMINIKNINKLGADYNLYPPSLDTKIFKGPLFIKYNNYNPIVIIVGLFFSVLIIVFVGVYSHLQIKKRMESNAPDSVI
tara:strand:+ start:644 stop:1786 length:1143 start_codon:yes stop_codon:yes gene_type:complete